MRRRATTNLDDIRRMLRLGMGPCQGGFCIYRATGILHGLDGMSGEQANGALLGFLQERWKGMWPILYGDQLRQARLDDWIFQGVLDVEHLPGMRRAALSFDAVVHRRRHRRADAPRRGWPRAARGSACWPRASARRTWRPGRSTCSATRPSAWRSPRRALGELAAARPDHPYALHGRRARRARAAVVRRARSPAVRSPAIATSATSSATTCCPPRSARCARRRSCPRRWPGRHARRASRCASSGPARCATSTRRCAPANLDGAGIAARAIDDRPRARPRRRQRARPRAALRRPDFRAAFAAALVPQLRGDERVALPGGARPARPARRVGRPAAAPGPRRVRDPDAAAVGAGHARLRGAARGAARAPAGASILGSEVVGAERDGGRVTAVRAHAAGHDVRYHARWFVLATGGFASGAIALGSDWVTRETVLGLPLRGAPAPGERASWASTWPSSRWRGWAWRSTATLRAEGAENVLVAGASLPGAVPWREGSGEGIALASGHRAARGRAGRGCRREGGGMSEGVLESSCAARWTTASSARSARRPVRSPTSRRSSAGPSTRARRPSASAWPTSRRSSVGRLLLGLRDLHAGVPAGREDRRDQRAGAHKLKRQKGVPLRDRIITRPTWLGRAGTPAAKVANRTIDPAAADRSARSAGVHRDAPAPDFAGRRSRAGRGSTRARRSGARSSTSTAAAPTTTSPSRARRPSRSSSTTAARSRSPSRTAAGCRCSPTGCSTMRASTCCGWRATSRQHARRGHDHRRQRDELHADAQARGARDPRPRGRPRARAGQRAHLRHLRATCSSCTTAAS